MVALAGLLIYYLFSPASRAGVPVESPDGITNSSSKEQLSMNSPLSLTSSAFVDQGTMDSRFTCDGPNTSPPLSISGVPAEAKSLVLIMDDPDVPTSVRADGMWDHWVKFNMPTDTREIAEGTEPPGVSGAGTRGNLTYSGPCPPDREHRYFFKLYALDVALSLKEGASKQEVERAIEGHVVAEAQLVGRYNRKGN